MKGPRHPTTRTAADSALLSWFASTGPEGAGAEAIDGSARVPEAADESRSKIRVVLVDDDPTLTQLIQLELEDTEDIAVVGVAHDGNTGLSLIQEQHPDLVLLDVSMPSMDGIEVARRVDAQFPDVTVLILTGWPGDLTKRLLQHLGVKGYLTKPVLRHTLVDAIRQTVPTRKAD
jgi:DNA-binding NarL/FixJ family response regulator